MKDPQQRPHIPIMVEEILDGLFVHKNENAIYIDGTLGAGGHTHAILSAREDNRVIGFDRDPNALELAGEFLTPFAERAQLIHASYLSMGDQVEQKVDGILLDLGLSSMQLDEGKRGFSFRYDAPLDMRFDPTSDDLTAADILNMWSAEAIADVIYHYGEDRNSRRIASAIIENRPLETTGQLAQIIEDQHRGKRERIHPATRTFQALRIAVNKELEAVETVLPIALDQLKSGGRLAIMTFHSLEDRIAKHYFKEQATDCICPSDIPICVCDHEATVKLITRKPLTASSREVNDNPRARSAKLRIVEKI